ncbi:hypothetical protein [Nocardiopsis sp. NRRL B-16309]|uniref:hypothetical protein n=1 Tax=Nocardiopsis sp. NRRL B-16309 TaxID=1519494 RepID=UPI0006AF9915|nr:hypothetical protein [Nocardiopsis sp. NRRL B-16309]KOX10104.1 hypothetical protein ADL05_25815 [Nocardiopsis sp. NRRL B-16309]
MTSPDPLDLSLRAIALVRAVHDGDQDRIAAAVDGLDPTDVLGVAIQGATLTAALIRDNSPHSVDQVCRKLERNVRSS